MRPHWGAQSPVGRLFWNIGNLAAKKDSMVPHRTSAPWGQVAKEEE